MTQLLMFGSFGALLAALILALIRLIRGREPGNMIIALDLIASIVMGYILVYAVWVNKSMYFDIAIVISLISFMGTVAISNFLKENR